MGGQKSSHKASKSSAPRCTERGCSEAPTTDDRCSKHKRCSFPDCPNTRIRHTKVCIEHQCKILDCSERLAKDSPDLCEQHLPCDFAGCHRQRMLLPDQTTFSPFCNLRMLHAQGCRSGSNANGSHRSGHVDSLQPHWLRPRNYSRDWGNLPLP
jgi:hypothetical protein